MADLVTLQEAKDYCAVDSDYFDGMLATLITAASDAVTEYADGWDGVGEVPARLKLAVLARVAAQFDTREEISEAKGERLLIQPFRVLEV